MGIMDFGSNSQTEDHDDWAVDETGMQQILPSVPNVDSPEPIRALTSFCSIRLKFDVKFIVTRHSSWRIDQPYEIQVFFPEGVLIAQCKHTSIQDGIEVAAKDALKIINYDVALLKHYVKVASPLL